MDRRGNASALGHGLDAQPGPNGRRILPDQAPAPTMAARRGLVLGHACRCGSSQNIANWQWVAGCGADAAPYFRIFNPITQGAKFDATGRYLHRWQPAASSYEPGSAGVPPIIGRRQGREKALAAFRSLSDRQEAAHAHPALDRRAWVVRELGDEAICALESPAGIDESLPRVGRNGWNRTWASPAVGACPSGDRTRVGALPPNPPDSNSPL